MVDAMINLFEWFDKWNRALSSETEPTLHLVARCYNSLRTTFSKTPEELLASTSVKDHPQCQTVYRAVSIIYDSVMRLGKEYFEPFTDLELMAAALCPSHLPSTDATWNAILERGYVLLLAETKKMMENEKGPDTAPDILLVKVVTAEIGMEDFTPIDPIEENTPENELSRFQKTKTVSAVLKTFWKSNQTIFPHLAKLANEVYTVPASSVSSERLFSEMGRLCSKLRGGMKPETADKLQFVTEFIRQRDGELDSLTHDPVIIVEKNQWDQFQRLRHAEARRARLKRRFSLISPNPKIVPGNINVNPRNDDIHDDVEMNQESDDVGSGYSSRDSSFSDVSFSSDDSEDEMDAPAPKVPATSSRFSRRDSTNKYCEISSIQVGKNVFQAKFFNCGRSIPDIRILFGSKIDLIQNWVPVEEDSACAVFSFKANEAIWNKCKSSRTFLSEFGEYHQIIS